MKKLSKKQKAIFGLLIVFVLICVLIYVIVTDKVSSPNTNPEQEMQSSYNVEMTNPDYQFAYEKDGDTLEGVSSLCQDWQLLDSNDGYCKISFNYNGYKDNKGYVEYEFNATSETSVNSVQVGTEFEFIPMYDYDFIKMVKEDPELLEMYKDSNINLGYSYEMLGDKIKVKVDLPENIGNRLSVIIQLYESTVVYDYDDNYNVIKIPNYLTENCTEPMSNIYDVFSMVCNPVNMYLQADLKDAEKYKNWNICYPNGSNFTSYSVSLYSPNSGVYKTVGDYVKENLKDGYPDILTKKEVVSSDE